MKTALKILAILALMAGVWHAEVTRNIGRSLTAVETAGALPLSIALLVIGGAVVFGLLWCVLYVTGHVPTKYERSEQERFERDYPLPKE